LAALVGAALLALLGDRLAHPRYPDETGVAGELVAGRTIGQTFRAQYDDLAGVNLRLATYARPQAGTVVLHLRAAVTATRDLATVAVPAAVLADNAWQRFTFPLLPDSRGRSYYVELEHQGGAPGQAVTAYWALGRGDPYPYGQATENRTPSPAT